MIRLGENQKLIYAGRVALRAPDGALLPSVPQYMIVSSDANDSAGTMHMQDHECLVIVGTLHNDKKSAEQRFADLKAGRDIEPKADGTPLYIKENADNFNSKTNLSVGEEATCDQLIGDLVAEFSRQMRKLKAMERQQGENMPSHHVQGGEHR